MLAVLALTLVAVMSTDDSPAYQPPTLECTTICWGFDENPFPDVRVYSRGIRDVCSLSDDRLCFALFNALLFTDAHGGVLDTLYAGDLGLIPGGLSAAALAPGPDGELFVLDDAHHSILRIRDRQIVESTFYGARVGDPEFTVLAIAVDPDGRTYLVGGVGAWFTICGYGSPPDEAIVQRLDEDGYVEREWRSLEHRRAFDGVWTERGLMIVTAEDVMLLNCGESKWSAQAIAPLGDVRSAAIAGTSDRLYVSVLSSKSQGRHRVVRLKEGTVVESWTLFPNGEATVGWGPGELAFDSTGRLHALRAGWRRDVTVYR